MTLTYKHTHTLDHTGSPPKDLSCVPKIGGFLFSGAIPNHPFIIHFHRIFMDFPSWFGGTLIFGNLPKKTEVRELPEGTHMKSVESPSFPKETCLQMVGFHTSMLVYQMDLYRCYLIISHSYLASLTDVPFFFGIRIGLRKLLSIPFADFNCDRSGVRLWSPKSRTRNSYFRSWDGIESLCGSFPRTEPTNQHGRGNATNYVILFLFPMVFAFVFIFSIG